MEFIGKEGWPAPRLQDVEISESKARELYWDLCLNIRSIYHKCKLVHGDLSEFNLLYHDGKAYVIDVSQSVEHDHPHALEFLRKDIHNVNEFFKKKRVNVLTVKELFDFVVDPTINEDDQEKSLEELSQKASERTDEERSAQEEIENEVFKQIFIPRKLIDVDFPERDINKAKANEDDPAYKSVTGVQLNKDVKDENESNESASENSENDESDDSDKEDEEGTESTKGFKNSHRPRDESPNSRKERKKAIKAEQAEKRKTKVKKHVKKRKEKTASTKKK